MRDYDVVVIGAGAAGMMCAAQAGQRGRRVLLIEHYHVLGEKIRISGGGRCNFTNIDAGPANYPFAESGFLPLGARALHTARFHCVWSNATASPITRRSWASCSATRPARDIIRHAEGGMRRAAASTWWMPCAVDAVSREARSLRRRHARRAACAPRRWSIATGGLTVPKIGATPFGVSDRRTVRAARRARRGRRSCRWPSRPTRSRATATWPGVSVDAEIACNGGRFRENLLFTHRGLSGPAILQISSYWDGREPLTIDLLPGDRRGRLAAVRARRTERCCPTLLAEKLPKRFAQQWCAAHDAALPVQEHSATAGCATSRASLHRWPVLPSGTLGYNKAEVTLGGVDTRDLSSKTMAARRRARPLLHRRSRSTSPAGSAATTSSGRGRRDTRRVRLSDRRRPTCAAAGVRHCMHRFARQSSRSHRVRSRVSLLHVAAMSLRCRDRARASEDRPHGLRDRPHDRDRHSAEEYRRPAAAERSATRRSSTSSSTTAATRRAPCRTSRSSSRKTTSTR